MYLQTAALTSGSSPFQTSGSSAPHQGRPTYVYRHSARDGEMALEPKRLRDYLLLTTMTNLLTALIRHLLIRITTATTTTATTTRTTPTATNTATASAIATANN